MTKEARLPTATSDWPEFESQPDPVLIIVMYCTINVENQIKKIFREKYIQTV